MLESCAGSTAGVEALRCLVVEANYLPIIFGLALLGLILFSRMSYDTVNARISTTFLVLSFLAILFSIAGFLPKDLWIAYMIVFVASVIGLYVTK